MAASEMKACVFYVLIAFYIVVTPALSATQIDVSDLQAAADDAQKIPRDGDYLPPLSPQQRKTLARWYELFDAEKDAEIIAAATSVTPKVIAHPRLGLQLALVYLRQDNYEAAIDALDPVLLVVPAWQPALLALAQAYQGQARYQAMLPVLAQALTPATATPDQWRWYLAVALAADDAAVAGAVAEQDYCASLIIRNYVD